MNEETEHKRILRDIIGIVICLSILFFLALFLITGGCVTAAKNTYHGLTATPIPTPTPEPPTPEPTPTPTPEPTIDPIVLMRSQGGYFLDEWHTWYRENVSGNQDMVTRVTVYNTEFMPFYHWRDFSWGSWASRKVSPEEGKVYLFVFVRMESIGNDVRQYGMPQEHYYVQYKDRLYYAQEQDAPQRIIFELEDHWTRDHVTMPGPYGWKRIQDIGSGFIWAEPLGYLRNGEPWDGYIIFELPSDAQSNTDDIKVIGRFDNLGGQVYWKTTKQI